MSDRGTAAQTYRHAKQEAIFALIVWFLALLWTVGYCYLRGYQHPPDSTLVRWGLAEARTPENFQHFVGVPDWVIWGVAVPWVICTIITIIFALCFMKEDDLSGPLTDNEH